MRIQAVSFGSYRSPLKAAWKKGLLPTVKRGIYGKELTLDNISLEHIIPHSKGGKTILDNLFLADSLENARRGVKPIADVITKKQLADYLEQFKDIKVKKFNGNDYIMRILKTIAKLGGLKE